MKALQTHSSGIYVFFFAKPLVFMYNYEISQVNVLINYETSCIGIDYSV